jgi:cytochrome b561
MVLLEHSAVRQSDILEPSRPSFDTVTITVHWISLLLVLAMIGTGLQYGLIESRPWAPALLWAHRSLGVILWVITVARVAWRLTRARTPGFPSSMTRMQRLAARSSEYGLYVLLLIQPVTGLAQTLWRGAPFELLAWTVPAIASKHFGYVVLFYAVHRIGAWCLVGLVTLHAAAALFHHFVQRDHVLETMAPILRRKRDFAAATIPVRLHR